MPNPDDKPKGKKTPQVPGGHVVMNKEEYPIRYDGVCPPFDHVVGAAVQDVFARDFVPFEREDVEPTQGFYLYEHMGEGEV